MYTYQMWGPRCRTHPLHSGILYSTIDDHLILFLLLHDMYTNPYSSMQWTSTGNATPTTGCLFSAISAEEHQWISSSNYESIPSLPVAGGIHLPELYTFSPTFHPTTFAITFASSSRSFSFSLTNLDKKYRTIHFSNLCKDIKPHRHRTYSKTCLYYSSAWHFPKQTKVSGKIHNSEESPLGVFTRLCQGSAVLVESSFGLDL